MECFIPIITHEVSVNSLLAMSQGPICEHLQLLTSSRFALIAVLLLTGAATDVLLKALELVVATREDRLEAANWLAMTEEAMIMKVSE